MTSPARLAANRANAQCSTGPRTDAGKARSAMNAGKHFLAARATPVVLRGTFREDEAAAAGFVAAVVDELNPHGPREQAEALAIAGLYIRRARLQELEALALTGTTRAPLLPPAEPGGPMRVLEADEERAASRALTSDLLDKLPRYEAHLSRELDRCMTRLRRMQEERVFALKV